MEGYVKRQAVQEGVVPAEKPGKKDKMSRAANGKEFRQALEHSQADRLEKKERGGSDHACYFFPKAAASSIVTTPILAQLLPPTQSKIPLTLSWAIFPLRS